MIFPTEEGVEVVGQSGRFISLRLTAKRVWRFFHLLLLNPILDY